MKGGEAAAKSVALQLDSAPFRVLATRRLRWAACLNVRDLGGLPLAVSGRTRRGVIVRADDVARLTSDGHRELLRYGVRTVIDLRSAREVDRAPSVFSAQSVVAYRHAPLISEAEWTAIAARPLPPHEADVRTLQLSTARIVAVMAMVAHAEACLIVHCSAGLERTGIIAMLLLSLAGVAHTVIADDYVQSVDELRPLFAERLKQTADAEQRAGLSRWIEQLRDPLHVLATLDWLHRQGGVSAYLSRAGLPRDDLVLLGSRLLARPASASGP